MVKVAEAWPSGMTTLAGTVASPVSLLDRETLRFPKVPLRAT